MSNTTVSKNTHIGLPFKYNGNYYLFRYYKKSDINREKNGLVEDRLFNSISDYEVFSSNHRDTIFVESIVSTCKIYTYDEYENLAELSATSFFSRACFDPVKVEYI